jgi:hypothetical protein
MRPSAVAAALLTFNAFVFAAIVTEPTELPWMCTFPVTCSARPAGLVAVADMPIPVLVTPLTPVWGSPSAKTAAADTGAGPQPWLLRQPRARRSPCR